MNQVCCFTNMEEGVPGWEPSPDGEPYRILSTCVGNKIKIKMTLNSGRRENGVRRETAHMKLIGCRGVGNIYINILHTYPQILMTNHVIILLTQFKLLWKL